MTYSQILAETCPNRTEKRLKPSVIAQTRFQTVKFRPKLVRILEKKKTKMIFVSRMLTPDTETNQNRSAAENKSAEQEA